MVLYFLESSESVVFYSYYLEIAMPPDIIVTWERVPMGYANTTTVITIGHFYPFYFLGDGFEPSPP